MFFQHLFYKLSLQKYLISVFKSLSSKQPERRFLLIKNFLIHLNLFKSLGLMDFILFFYFQLFRVINF